MLWVDNDESPSKWTTTKALFEIRWVEENPKWSSAQSCCRANLAHINQSTPDSGIGVQVKMLKAFEVSPSLLASGRKRELFIDNLLVRIHFIIVMIRWTGLALWEFEFPFSGSLASTFIWSGTPYRQVCTIVACFGALRERVLYWQPTSPNPLNHRHNFSRPALRHGSLNPLFQVALQRPF